MHFKKKTKNAQPRLKLAPFERPIVVWCSNHWATKAMAQTQQSKPKLRLFRIRNLFYCCNIVLYYHKCNIFDNIKNIIAILDALLLSYKAEIWNILLFLWIRAEENIDLKNDTTYIKHNIKTCVTTRWTIDIINFFFSVVENL